MSQWTGEQRAFAIEAYFKANYSCADARQRFCSRYNIQRLCDAPSENLIRSWVQRFRTTGSAANNPLPGLNRTAVLNKTKQLLAMSSTSSKEVMLKHLPKPVIDAVIESAEITVSAIIKCIPHASLKSVIKKEPVQSAAKETTPTLRVKLERLPIKVMTKLLAQKKILCATSEKRKVGRPRKIRNGLRKYDIS